VLNVLDYSKYDTTTSIFTMNEQEAEFPNVSIFCADDPNFDPKILSIYFQNEDITLESYKDATHDNFYRFNSGKNMSNESYNQTIID